MLGDRIVAAVSPGVTAQNTFRGEPTALQEPVLADRLNAILRAGRGIDTAWRDPRRDSDLVEADEFKSEPAHHSDEG